MSHYNSGPANSWQNRSNNSSGTSSLFGTPHDLLNYSSAAAQQLSSQNNAVSSLNSSSNSSLVNNTLPNSSNVYSSPAASLLAQFAAVNSAVNFSNLAATLPAALVNANVIAAANLGAAVAANNVGNNNVAGGYQWHSSSQSSLPQSSSSQLSSSNRNTSDQRIVSIGNNSSSNNNSNNTNYKSASSNINKNSNSSSETVRPLMEIDTIRRQQQQQQQQNNSKINNASSNSNTNNKNSSSISQSPSLNNNNHNSHKNDHSSMSRDRERDRNRDRDRERDRDKRSSDRSSTTNNTNNTNKNNLVSSLNAAGSSLAVASPLAQALLNQLASVQSNAGGNTLATIQVLANNLLNSNVAKQQQTHKNVSPQHNRHNSMHRSRSPSSSNRHSNNNSGHKLNNSASSTRHSVGGISSNGTIKSNNNSNKQHSKSPINTSSTKRLSSSNNLGTNSSSANNLSHHTNKTTTSSSSASSSSNRHSSIKVPKYPLDSLTNNVVGLKARYNQLYIPSDFINVKNNWQNSLPLNRQLKFNSRCLFHIMRKDSCPVLENEAVFDPPDADHSWTVKVMLLAMPSMNELFKRSCMFAEDSLRSNERLEHPSKVIQFLVGNKGKHELMALGGAWSASLDGPDPSSNSQTLINTAIRTVKALTSIDLTPCTQWFRFLDIQYNRNEDYKTIILPQNSHSNEKKSLDIEDAAEKLNEPELKSGSTKKPEATLLLNDDKEIETTVIFLPNIWSLMPTSIEYQKIVDAYKNFIENPPLQITKSLVTENKPKQPEPKSQTEENLKQMEPEVLNETNKLQEDEEEKVDDSDTNGPVEVNSIEELTKSLKAEYGSTKHLNGQINSSNEKGPEDDENDDSESKLEATHYSKLDIKKMRVDELRTELMARDLDTRGLKNQLMQRLKEALENEKENDENQKDKNQEDTNKIEDSQVIECNKNENVELQSNNDNSDVVYTHVNDCDIESFQLDEKDEGVTNGLDKELSKDTKLDVDEKANIEKQMKQEKLARIDREKIYKLPQIPHLIVHPSKTAKNGKFECQLVSLSHLLDYRKNDNKESSFEVSLFAEYFNEMLIRDFGFIIYKHLLALRTEKDKELIGSVATMNTNNKRRLSSGNDIEEEIKRSKLNDDQDEQNKLSAKDQTEPESKISTTILLNKPKPKTVYPELLLSFVFLDINRTNHINEKDLEDLLLCIGLSLSRSKVKALISKISFKDSLLNYRTLTDKTNKEMIELESGVQFSLPSDDEIVSSIITYDSFMKRLNPSHPESGSNNFFDQETGFIELNGSTIDVLNTIKLLEKSEHTVLKLDQKLKDANEEIERLKTLNKTADRFKLRLTDELSDYKKKLRDQLRKNKETDDKNIRYKECLTRLKSNLNKSIDDVSDILKKSQSSSNKLKKSLSTETKTEEIDKTNLQINTENEKTTTANMEENLENNHEMNDATDNNISGKAEVIEQKSKETSENKDQDEKTMEISSNDV